MNNNQHSFEGKNIVTGYDKKIIIDGVDITIPSNKISVIIGSNGCGKSTLLKTLARLIKPISGDIVIDGKKVTSMPSKQLAKVLGLLPQSPVAPEGLTVLQLVKQGRFPYQSWRQQWTEKDEEIVMNALKATGTEQLRDRPVDELSGGQRQRAWIAMTLAQDTDIILLDEPTTYLDLTHQIEVLDLLFELNQQQKRTIIMVLHDINLACRYADHIITVRDRGVYRQGKPEEIMTTELVSHVFDLECQMTSDPIFGTPLCIPYGKGRNIT